MRQNMAYFRKKIKILREEYTDADRVEIIKSKGCKCELCGREDGATYLFGPTHYIKLRVKFHVKIHIHKIRYHDVVHKVIICDGCHLSYHLFNRLDMDASFGDKTIKCVADSKSKKRYTHSTR